MLVGAYSRSLIGFRLPLLRQLAASGDRVFAVASEIDAKTESVLGELGVITHAIQVERAGQSPLADLRYMRELVRFFREVEPDGVIAYTVKPVVYGMLAARLAGVPSRTAMITGLGYSFISDGSLKQLVIGSMVRGLYAAALRSSTAVSFQNDDDLALFRELRLIGSAETIVTAGSGVDSEHYGYEPLPEGPPWRVVTVARLLVDKGIRELAEAAAEIRARRPDIHFDLVGDLDSNPASISRSELDAWVREGVFEWHGEQDDVRPFICGAHLMVLPSYREGAARSLQEGMACGRPIITTNTPGCRQMVPDGGAVGALVPVKDAAALRDAILAHFDSPQAHESMSLAARERAVEVYDDKRVARELEALARRHLRG